MELLYWTAVVYRESTKIICMLEHFVHCIGFLYWLIWQAVQPTEIFFGLCTLCTLLSGSNLCEFTLVYCLLISLIYLFLLWNFWKGSRMTAENVVSLGNGSCSYPKIQKTCENDVLTFSFTLAVVYHLLSMYICIPWGNIEYWPFLLLWASLALILICLFSGNTNSVLNREERSSHALQ